MPLLRIDVIEGRSAAELKELLDAIHSAMLVAFKVPDRDRYQIVHEHPAAEMRIEGTGFPTRPAALSNANVMLPLTSWIADESAPEAVIADFCHVALGDT